MSVSVEIDRGHKERQHAAGKYNPIDEAFNYMSRLSKNPSVAVWIEGC